MNNHLSKADLYSDAYKQQVANFNESKIKQRLESKFEVKPYYLANKNLYYFSKFCSYAFNFLSICTSFTFVVSLLSGISFTISVALALIVLCVVEALKQFLIPDIAKNYLQFDKLMKIRIFVSILLICFSALCSYKGANLAVQMQTEVPEVINQDSIKNAYTAKIEALEAKQTGLSAIKYKGTTTRTAQRSIEKIQIQINSLTGLLQSELNQATNYNQTILTEHRAKTDVNGLYFALLALIFDLGLILSLLYSEYYDYRSICDFTIIGGVSPEKKNIPEPEELPEIEPDSDTDTANVQTVKEPVQTVKKTVQTEKKRISEGECLNCGKLFEKKNPRKKYCSDNCRLQFYNRKNGKPLAI